MSLADWVSFAFSEMAAAYGAKLAMQWPNGIGEARRKFTEALAGYRPSELARGIKALEHTPFPPTLPEFLVLCRGKVDAEEAFREAAILMGMPGRGRGRWSHPSVYWAAIRYGQYEVQRHPWTQAKTRWTQLYTAALAEDLQFPEAWEERKELAAPGQSVTDAETARARLAEVKAMIRPMPSVRV